MGQACDRQSGHRTLQRQENFRGITLQTLKRCKIACACALEFHRDQGTGVTQKHMHATDASIPLCVGPWMRVHYASN
jgi:hypothetical protein